MAKDRESGMMITTGRQGVGKTYQNMHLIYNYCRTKLSTKVRARKCLIIDTNGEYTKEQFERNNIRNFDPKLIKASDIHAWCRSTTIECRRIDAKSLEIKEKKRLLEYIMKNLIDCMLVLEDINTYILQVATMEGIIGKLVNLRHRAVDVLISFQSLRAVEPRLWQNSRWVRMHYQNDNVQDIKGKVTNPELMRISQLLVNEKYMNEDQRFFVYVNFSLNKVSGQFSKREFAAACIEYIYSSKKILKDFMLRKSIKQEDIALKGLIDSYILQYYGNNHGNENNN